MDSARKMVSYKLTQFGAPLSETIESPPSPTGTQVLLRVKACGVCHSDLHVADGFFDLGHGKKIDVSATVELPRILGHEIVGVVEEVGQEAVGVAAGDRRAIYAWGGCGQCAACRRDEENLCPRPRNLGLGRDGGFSNYVLVDHPKYLLEYDPLPEPFAATLGCSGLTAFNAVKKAAPVDAENPLLIIGAGGLGLTAVRLTQALYGVAPVVADVDPAKRQAALEAGAAHAVDPADAENRERFVKRMGGFSAAIDFVGAPASTNFGLGMLRKGGRLFVVGLYGGSIDIPLPTLPLRTIAIIGVFTGSLPQFRELMALARAGKIKPAPIEARPLAAAQRSLEDLRAGRIRGRAVLTP